MPSESDVAEVGGAWAVAYLRQHSLVTPKDIVDGSLTVTDRSSRNRNFVVTSAESPGYLLKKAGDGGSARLIEAEASVYQWLWQPANGTIQRYLPRFHWYDAANQTLVLDAIERAADLSEYHRKLGRFPVSTPAALGTALARLHGLPSQEASVFPQLDRASLALSLHRPGPDLLERASWGSLEVVKQIQRSADLGSSLDSLRNVWQDECVIHFDLKWDNCLLSSTLSTGRGLKLVDWEFAGIGDPRWDVGSVLGGYLAFWVRSIPLVGEMDAGQMARQARFPLDKMHPALRSFWRSYSKQAGIAEPLPWLLIAVGYAAAWLLDVALTLAQGYSEAPAHSLLLVQLALNISRSPEQALALLGLDSATA